jgi:hypothetical protein
MSRRFSLLFVRSDCERQVPCTVTFPVMTVTIEAVHSELG